jgi:hypothetical protein
MFSPFGRLWYTEIPHAIDMIETHEHAGDFKMW